MKTYKLNETHRPAAIFSAGGPRTLLSFPVLVSLCASALFLLASDAQAQWKYDVTLTGYPQARWKALTSYVDKPAIGDINGDGRPEIIGAGVFGDVYCVDGRTGQIIWTYEDEHSLELAVYICPVIIDLNCDKIDDVVSITPTGKVIALDGRNGRRLWSFQAEDSIVYSPTAFDVDRNGTAEIAVADSRGNLYLIANTGKQVWVTPNEAPLYGSPAVGLIGNQPVIIAGDRKGNLRAFDATNGSPMWKYSISASPVSTSPILFKDPQNTANPWRVLVGTEKGEVHLVNAQNGQSIWNRQMSKGVIGDFALGDFGNGGLNFVFSTSDSEIILATMADGKVVWNKKFKVPVREYLQVKSTKRIDRETLTGQPLIADGDGDGRLDVIVETRGLNSYVYCLGASDGRTIWNYGNKHLSENPSLSESIVVAGSRQDAVSDQLLYSQTVPVYSYPTPVIADFDGDGKADLIVNDRDEVGLINVPLAGNTGPGLWAKYANNACNNTAHFASSCLGTAPSATVRLRLEPQEITIGESARLCWTTSNTMQLEIDQGVGIIQGPEECVTVKPTRDTTWAGIARGCGGEARDSVSITVKVKPTPPPPPTPTTDAPVTLTENERETLTRAIKDVFFEYDYYRLTPEATKALHDDTQSLKAYPAARVALQGACDERGSTIYNQYLALARSESVREFLVSNGIDPSRLQVKPEGETTKYDSRRTEEGYAQNRRVHFVILP